jgi:RHS repeat-associated protein
MRATTDAWGVAQGACAGLPYGDGQACSGNIPDPRYFTGKERDAESGNDYFGARYYASSMGRWLSPDWSAKEEPVPYANLGDPQSLNLYAYVMNNPLDEVDVDGHAERDSDMDDLIGLLKGVYNGWASTNNSIMKLENRFLGLHREMLPLLKAKGEVQKDSLAGGELFFNLGLLAVDDGESPEALEQKTLTREAEDGIIYRRINPKTGEEYIGQAKSPERFVARQGEHDAQLGVKHRYQILEKGKPGQDINVREESQIRARGGPKNKGGTLANKRYQMSEKNYRAAGGNVNKPTR